MGLNAVAVVRCAPHRRFRLGRGRRALFISVHCNHVESIAAEAPQYDDGGGHEPRHFA